MDYLFPRLSVLIFAFALFDKAQSTKGDLEINYDQLPENFHHAPGSNAVYGVTEYHMVLGCMFPASASAAVQDAERTKLLWSKDETERVCAEILEIRDACTWEDPSATSPRGMKLLKVLLADNDNFRQGFAGSGTYTCYHSDKQYTAAQVKVWVAGSLLEIMVNGSKLPNKVHQLPEKTVSETDRKSLTLDCTVTAGAKGLQPDKMFEWYRNEQRIYPNSRFVFDDSLNKRLEIKNAGSGDWGVYMCVAEFEQQSGKPITSRQYVVLKGDPTSSAASIINRWRYHLLTYGFVIIFAQRVRHATF